MKTHADDYSWYIDELVPDISNDHRTMEELDRDIAEMEAQYKKKFADKRPNEFPDFLIKRWGGNKPRLVDE
jgi:hypothetical protein